MAIQGTHTNLATPLDCHVAKWLLAVTNFGEKQPATYIMASGRNGTIYVGVTSKLAERVWQHRNGANPGFASDHQCTLLVYYELHSGMTEAIIREKRLKAGKRVRKLKLIETANPTWRDLYEEIL